MTYRYIHPSYKHQMVALSARKSVHSIADYLDCHKSTVYRVNALANRTGDVVTHGVGPGRPRQLTSLDLDYLEGCIERTPDILLLELKLSLEEVRGIEVSEATISRALHRRGLTRKRVTRPALERNEEARAEYWVKLAEGGYRPDQLVFLDESACDRRTARRPYAWAPCGSRARRHDYFIRGTRYSMLPALSLDGILHLEVQDRSFTSVDVYDFADALLDNMNPFPRRNSVLVMDNASIHKSQALRALVEARGMRLIYLPAYSPDYNPIEEAFSAIKAWIRANRALVLGEMTGEAMCDPYAILWEAVFGTVTRDKAAGWFRGCGYIH